MVKRIIPGNMSPWECEINDVKYVYPPGTEQMVPDEVAHVIDAWYASQEPKYPEPESGGGSGGGAQPDWNAAEGEPGHILNRPFYEDTVTLFDQTVELQDMDGMMAYAGMFPEPLENKTYKVTYNGVLYNCAATDPEGAGVPMALGNLGAMGAPDTGEPFLMAISDEDGDGVTDIILIDLTGATSATVKIEKPGEPKKIDRKFAPDIPYFDLVSLGVGTLKLDGKLSYAGIGINLYKALAQGPVQIRVKHQDYWGTERDATAIVTGVLYRETNGTTEYNIGWTHTIDAGPEAVYVNITCSYTGYVEARVFKRNLGTTGST